MSDIYKIEYKIWSDHINRKKLWEAINWKGNFSKQVTERPSTEELSTYFEVYIYQKIATLNQKYTFH